MPYKMISNILELGRLRKDLLAQIKRHREAISDLSNQISLLEEERKSLEIMLLIHKRRLFQDWHTQ